MARTISDIQAQIVAQVQGDPTLGPLATNTSVTARWRIWTFIVASAIYVHEVLWDAFRAEVVALVAAGKPHTLRWYQGKALAFQLGGALTPGEDYYDNTGLTPDQVAAQRIIAQAAAVEGSDALIVKVAKLSGGELAPLTVGETTAISAYFADIKDAGVKLQVRSVAADHLKCEVDVYYDAAILGPTGQRLDGSAATPVLDAAKAYLRALPFDGVFTKAHLVDAIQKVEGVVVPDVRVCMARRNDDPTFFGIEVFYEPFSGFVKIYSTGDFLVNYIAA
jgi:hypothetical protein